MPLFLVLNSTITSEYKTKSYLSISPCHNQQLTPSTAWTEYSIPRVQHTPRKPYTEYCIHHKLHHPKIDGLPAPSQSSHLSADYGVLNSLHSHNYELTNELSLSSRRISLPNYRLTIDHIHFHLQSRSIMASNCISKLARSQHPSVSPSSLDNGFHVHLQPRSITASKCIYKLARLRPPSSHDHRMQVHLQSPSMTASKCIYKLARLRPPS
jgi:hypothetical protein